jgi:hypothetical protein
MQSPARTYSLITLCKCGSLVSQQIPEMLRRRNTNLIARRESANYLLWSGFTSQEQDTHDLARLRIVRGSIDCFQHDRSQVQTTTLPFLM